MSLSRLPSRRNKEIKKIRSKLLRAGLLIAFGYLLAFSVNAWELRSVLPTDIHYHADIAVFINGQWLDFSSERYQASETNQLGPYIHFHDGNGQVLHVHKSSATLGDLFKSFEGELSWHCLKIESARFCSRPTSGLRVFINGRRLWLPGNYKPKDGDRILIVYGGWLADVMPQQAQVSDQACIYSLTCPERGTPPTENCLPLPGDTCVLPGESVN